MKKAVMRSLWGGLCILPAAAGFTGCGSSAQEKIEQ
jgi:hypothetical protein